MVDIEALCKGYLMHMPHLFILKGNTMFFLVKWNLYIVYEKAMQFWVGLCSKIKIFLT